MSLFRGVDADTVSHPGGNPSIGEASLSLGSGSQLEREADRESASMVALAGSIISALPGGHRYTSIEIKYRHKY